MESTIAIIGFAIWPDLTSTQLLNYAIKPHPTVYDCNMHKNIESRKINIVYQGSIIVIMLLIPIGLYKDYLSWSSAMLVNEEAWGRGYTRVPLLKDLQMMLSF